MKKILLTLAVLVCLARPALANYPAFVGSAVLDTDLVSDTNHTFDIKTGMTNGNLAIIFWGGSGIDGSPNFACTGWTVIEDQITGFGSGHLGIAARIVDGTEGTTVTCTTDVAEVGTSIAVEISGINSSDAITDGDGINGTSGAPNPENLNPATWDVEDTMWIAVAYVDGPITITAYPSGFTDNQTNGTATSQGDIALATKNEAVASQDPGAFTAANSNWAAVTIAIRPSIPTGGGGGGAIRNTMQLLGVQ